MMKSLIEIHKQYEEFIQVQEPYKTRLLSDLITKWKRTIKYQ